MNQVKTWTVYDSLAVDYFFIKFELDLTTPGPWPWRSTSWVVKYLEQIGGGY